MAKEQFWSVDEDMVLRKYYQTGGSKLCQKYLPLRARNGIARRASRLGLTSPIRGKKTAKRDFITRLDRDWKKLLAEVPQDTRTPGQRLLGDPVFERSALYKKQMEAR